MLSRKSKLFARPRHRATAVVKPSLDRTPRLDADDFGAARPERQPRNVAPSNHDRDIADEAMRELRAL